MPAKTKAKKASDGPTQPAKKTAASRTVAPAAPPSEPRSVDRGSGDEDKAPTPADNNMFAGKTVFLSKCERACLTPKYIKAAIAALDGTVTASMKQPVDMVLGDEQLLSEKARQLRDGGAAHVSWEDACISIGEWAMRRPRPALPDGFATEEKGPFGEELAAKPQVLAYMGIEDRSLAVVQYEYVAPTEHSSARYTVQSEPGRSVRVGIRPEVPYAQPFGELLLRALSGRG